MTILCTGSPPNSKGINPPPFHWMDLCLVVPDSTARFVNSQLVRLPPAGLFKKFLLKLHYLFAHFSVIN